MFYLIVFVSLYLHTLVYLSTVLLLYIFAHNINVIKLVEIYLYYLENNNEQVYGGP